MRNGGAYLRVCEDPMVGSNLTSSALGGRVAAALYLIGAFDALEGLRERCLVGVRRTIS
jgi:hypothetical protein